jgi:hypothetical protein
VTQYGFALPPIRYTVRDSVGAFPPPATGADAAPPVQTGPETGPETGPAWDGATDAVPAVTWRDLPERLTVPGRVLAVMDRRFERLMMDGLREGLRVDWPQHGILIHHNFIGGHGQHGAATHGVVRHKHRHLRRMTD